MNKYILILLFSVLSLSFDQNQNNIISYKIKQLNYDSFDSLKSILLLDTSNYKVFTDYCNLTDFINNNKDKNILTEKDFYTLKKINLQSDFPININDFFIPDKKRINYIIAELLQGGYCLIVNNNAIVKEIEVKEIVGISSEKKEFWIKKLKIISIITKVF